MLQAVAAILVILGAFLTIPRLLQRAFRPDLVLRIDRDQSTLPPDVKAWAESAAIRLGVFAEEFGTTTITPEEEELLRGVDTLLGLSKQETAQRLQNWTGDFEALRLQIRNQTNRTLAGVRVRVDNANHLWSVELQGNFITNREIEVFLKNLARGEIRSGLVLPELPPLPAESVLDLILYLDTARFAEAHISAQHVSTDIEEVIRLEDSWLVTLYREPWLLLMLLSLMGLIIVPLVGVARAISRKRAIARALPDAIYNAACEAALAGRAPQAITLLETAFRVGYTNKAHARQDSDFVSLRELPEFQALVQ